MNLNEFFEIIQEKTIVGIEQLKEVQMGTEEYGRLVNQIISNVNLLADKERLLNPAPVIKEFDPKNVIGKDFK
jgi:hypothetical protein